MSDDRLVKMVLLGSVHGIRQRGRPPKRWTDNITEWTELTLCEAVRLSQHAAGLYLAPTVTDQVQASKGQEEDEDITSTLQCAVKGKDKGPDTCYSAAYVNRPKTNSALQSRKWQLVGMSR